MTSQGTDDRVTVRVSITVGPEAWVVTPRHDWKTPLKMLAADIARDAALPANELPGREFHAVPDGDGYRDFRLVDDPRL
jgi:hypothetical protein